MKNNRIQIVLSCAAAAFIPFGGQPGAAGASALPVTVITGAEIIDGTGKAPFRGDLLIRGERIEAVGPKLPVPTGATVIDATGKTILPGLFDVHTHIPFDPTGRSRDEWVTTMQAHLYFGVTTAVNFSGHPESIDVVRRLLANGTLEGPRIQFAGRISTPAGHGTERNQSEMMTPEVVTPLEGRAAVRRLLPYKPDVLKIFTDGWRYGSGPDMTSMREDTLAAIVDEAHKNGLEVLTHTVTVERAKIAARAGVDVIAHGVSDGTADAELLGLLKKGTTAYAPTLAVYEPRAGRGIVHPLYPNYADRPAASTRTAGSTVMLTSVKPAAAKPPAKPGTDPKRPGRWSYLLQNTGLIHAAGATMAVGTDSGISGTPAGWATLREIKLLVRGGLSPLAAITAATGNSARVLHLDDQRGTIAPGKLADLMIIAGHPHRNIDDLDRIDAVFLGGRPVDRPRLASAMAAGYPGPLPSVKVGALIDDFESSTERSRLDTVWYAQRDAGINASPPLSLGRVLRTPRDRALMLMARMGESKQPYARAIVELSRGKVQPADLTRYRGVRFDARGDGDYSVIFGGQRASDAIPVEFRSPVPLNGQWRTVKIPFSSFKTGEDSKAAEADPAAPPRPPAVPATWSTTRIHTLVFQFARPPGAMGWLELDNIRFYE
jgi:imidazolonepropionase-like amidohydrolase